MSFCDEGGMPVTGSSFALSCAIVHDGVMRRSEEEAVEVISRGISRAVVSDGGMAHEMFVFSWDELGRNRVDAEELRGPR